MTTWLLKISFGYQIKFEKGEKQDILGQFHQCFKAAFEYKDPKSAKKTEDLTVFSAPLGYAVVKEARKLLMKLTPVLSNLNLKFWP